MAGQSTPARTQAKKAQQDAAEVEDFDAFWSKQKRRGLRLGNVFGVPVELPPSLPLAFEVAQRQLASSQAEEDVRYMVGLLFGEGALERWRDAGMDGEQFAVLLMWGSANCAAGKHAMTLDEARGHYLSALETGKLPTADAVGKGRAAAPKTGPRASTRKRAPAKRGG